jgi:hypothetical protein
MTKTGNNMKYLFIKAHWLNFQGDTFYGKNNWN